MRQSFLEIVLHIQLSCGLGSLRLIVLVLYLPLFMLPVKKENMILKFAIILSSQKIEKQFKSSKTLELSVDMVRSRP